MSVFGYFPIEFFLIQRQDLKNNKPNDFSTVTLNLGKKITEIK